MFGNLDWCMYLLGKCPIDIFNISFETTQNKGILKLPAQS